MKAVDLVATYHVDLKNPPHRIDTVELRPRMRILLVRQQFRKENGVYAYLWGRLRKIRSARVFVADGWMWGNTKWRKLGRNNGWYPYVVKRLAVRGR